VTVAFNPNFGYTETESVYGRTDNAFSYGLSPNRERPIARTDRPTYEMVLGSAAKLDGTPSYDPSNLDLFFRWRFLKVPPTSAVILRGFKSLTENASIVSFVPDIVGSYEIALQVNNGADESDEVICTVAAFASLVPYCRGIMPSGEFLWSFLGDAWQYVQDRNIFGVAWSGYIQSMGSMLLDGLQADSDKSLMDIQRMARHRWYRVDPKIDLSGSTDWTAVFGYSVGGDAAITGKLGVPGIGFASDKWTTFIYKGILSESDLGKALLFTSVPSDGRYGFDDWIDLYAAQTTFICESLTPTRDGIVVQRGGVEFPSMSLPDDVDYDLPGTKPVPDPIRGKGTKVVEANRVRWFSESQFLAYLNEDFTPRRLPRYVSGPYGGEDLGSVVRPGDYIRLANGTIAGVHRITDIWRYDPTDSDTWTFAEGWDVDYLCSLFGWETPDPGAPPYLDPFDLMLIDTTSPNGSPPAGHTWEQATFDVYAPLSYAIPGATELFTSIVNIPLSSVKGEESDDNSAYRDLSDVLGGSATVPRLLHIQGGTYPIKYSVTTGTDPDDQIGDVAEFGMTTIEIDGQIPAGMSGVPWRISNTIKVPGHDFPNEGVCAGDTLVVRVVPRSTELAVSVAATVLGANADMLGVEFTIRPFIYSEQLDLDIRILYQILDAAKMQGFALVEQKDNYGRTVHGDDGLPIYEIETSTVFAADALALARSTGFRNSTHGVDINANALLVLVPNAVEYTFSLSYLIRNTIIPVDDDVRSLPCLFELIDPPPIRTDGEKKYVELPDGTEREVSRFPYALAENIDYMVEQQTAVRAEGAETRANSREVRLNKAYLLSRRFLPGDSLTINEGYSAGDYTILKILGQELAQVTPVPQFAQYGGQYTLKRNSITGTHIRFLNKIFSPALPVPGPLWCEEAFFDNNKRIENIHGYRVKVSLADLDETDTQLDYLSVVRGLAYVTSRPATLRDIHLGVSILLGLPFTIYPCRVVDIDQDYQRNPYTRERETGRIVLEVVNEYGDGTGVLTSFTYPEGVPASRNYYEDLLGTGATEGFEFEEEEWYGLSINPSTGNRWAIGDLVPTYTCLANGVQVKDYITDPTWFRAFSGQMNVLKYHNWMIAVREDLATENELDLVYRFLFETARPKHTNLLLLAYKALYDQVDIFDKLLVRIDKTLYDQAGGGFQQPLMLDAKSASLFPLFLPDSDPFEQLTPRMLRGVSFEATGEGELLATIEDIEESQEISGYDPETETYQTTSFGHIPGGLMNRMFNFADEVHPYIEPDFLVLRGTKIIGSVTGPDGEEETRQSSLWDGYYHLKTRIDATHAILKKVDTTTWQGVPNAPDPASLMYTDYPFPVSGRGAIMRRHGRFLHIGTMEVIESDATAANTYEKPYCVARLIRDGEPLELIPQSISIGDHVSVPWEQGGDDAGKTARIIALRNEDGADMFQRIGEEGYVPSGNWNAWDDPAGTGVFRMVLDSPLAVGENISVVMYRESLAYVDPEYEGCEILTDPPDGVPHVQLDGDMPLPRSWLLITKCVLVLGGAEYRITDAQGGGTPGYYIQPPPPTDISGETVQVISTKDDGGLNIDFRYDQIPSDALLLEFPTLEMMHDGYHLYPTGYGYDDIWENIREALGPYCLVRFLDEPDSILDFGFGCGYATVREVAEDGLVISVSGAGTKRIRIVRLPK
jgi:hypothetical protein